VSTKPVPTKINLSASLVLAKPCHRPNSPRQSTAATRTVRLTSQTLKMLMGSVPVYEPTREAEMPAFAKRVS
jgi:hypothetical protein